MQDKYRRKITSVTLIRYHFVWLPARRKKVLVGGVSERLKQLLTDKCIELDCSIVTMEIMPDHVHLLVDAHLIWLQTRLCLGSKGLLRFSLGRNIRISKKFLLFGLEVIFAVRSATLLRKLLRNILKTNILEGGVTAASPIPTPKGVGTGDRGQVLSG
jgi:hypothetical protein